jgi:hypothetical protein
MILPFLEDNAVIVFHDVSLHTKYFLRGKYFDAGKAITNNLLMSSITGRKILQGNYGGEYFPNIAGIRINKNTKENIFEIFNLLMIKWAYLPTEEQEQEITAWLEKYYDKYYIDYLRKIFSYQKIVLGNDKQYRIRNNIKKILGKENISRIRRIIKLFKN